MGRNQTDFAALASASKGAQINWEKDVSSPPGTALRAFAEAGADVLYILTGRRQSALLNQSEQAFAGGMIRSMEDALRNPEEEARKHGLSVEVVKESARETLQRLATNPELPDEVRRDADDLLRRYLDDAQAAKRRSARFAAFVEARQRAERDLEDTFSGFDRVLPGGVRDQLVALSLNHGIKLDDLMPLLAELAKLFPRPGIQLGEPVR
ncbi:MAG TPA: hypothetical protein VH331_14325 [Allosphingosinicella sp.]|nr:hypothetical protein [Allosphingosinicella sp.]